MAFLCPSRLGRSKRKQGYDSMMERLVETGSIDTITLEDLVKLSWKTPEARRIILQNFTSCAPQEITVKQGQKVNYIYREGDWAYVVTDDKKEGFVPFAFLAKIGVPSKPTPRKIDSGTYTKRASDLKQRKVSDESEGTDLSASDVADDSFTSTGCSDYAFTEYQTNGTSKERPSVNYLQTETGTMPMFYEVFLDERTNILHKNPLPAPNSFNEKEIGVHPTDDIGLPSPPVMFKVMHNFSGQEEYDIPVKAGEIVYLLDDSDRGWYWVYKTDGTEGYVPSNYISEMSEDSINDVNIPKHELSVIKSFQNELPTKWKVTNDLSGKSPVLSTSPEKTAAKSDKQKPLKPPRRKKNQDNSRPSSLNDSIDSIDIYITDSSAEYLDYENKSSYDELSPRSNVFSDSSILDSSYNEIYNHGNNFFLELSPRSIDSENSNLRGNDTGMDITTEVSSTPEICSQTHKPRNSVKKDKCAYASTNKNKYRKDIGQCKQGINDDRVRNVTDDVQKQEHYIPSNRNHISNSGKSKQFHGSQHKRPLSMPAFKSYQEYMNDYYDEYFYEDTDTEFSSRSKSNVVNVSEILKIRKRNEQRKQIRKSESCVEDRINHHKRKNELPTDRERNAGEIIARVDKVKADKHIHNKQRQFLLDHRYTKQESDIQNGKRVENVNKTNEKLQKQLTKSFNLSNEIQFENCVKNVDKRFEMDREIADVCDKRNILHADRDLQVSKPMFRQFNSSTDLTQIEIENRTEKARKDKIKTRSTDLAGFLPENKDKNTKQGKNTYLRAYSSSTDLREIRGKPDWSFGYPRKTRKSIGRATTETSDTCNESRRKENKKDQKSNDEPKDETRKSMHAEANLGSVLDEESALKTNDTTESVENSFNDEAMMALLSQTDSLLQKTDHLLGRDKTRILQEKTSGQVINICNNMSVCDTESRMTPTADEKCNKFLKNSTIGIHGMTYIITEDNVKNRSEDSEIHSTSKTKYMRDVKDQRKEKSNVMKENSSKIVSEELKSLDLQDIRGITEFVCQCDYEPDTDNMLPIKHGEILHIGLDGQDSGEWYWAFSPRLKKNGFVPKKIVKIPMVTII